MRQVTDSTGTIWQSTDSATWGTLSGTTVTALTKDATVTINDPAGQNQSITVTTYEAIPDARNQFIAAQRKDVNRAGGPTIYLP